jgi:hypothetical protein
MRCDCLTTSQLWNEEARAYADEHLEPVEVRPDRREVLHRCPETEREWLEEVPGSEAQGARALRLRRLTP